MKKRIKVVSYSRVSTEDEKQLKSLKNQVNFFDDFIQKNDEWEFVGRYIDEGKTGTSTKSRTQFIQMIEDAKEGKFDLIVTKEISRFARNTLDSLYYTRKLLEMGIGVYFINDNLNTLDPNNQFRLIIMSGVAEEESRKISERVKFGHKKSFSDGVVFGNNSIWGYKKENGKLVVDDKEAEIVKLIFDLYVNNDMGVRKIQKHLFDKGIINRNGKPFSPTTLKRIIKNPKYKGTLVQGLTKKDFETKKIRKTKEDEWFIMDDAVPAIIDKETWEKAQEKMNARRTRNNYRGVFKGSHKFSGKIFCAKCGRPCWYAKFKTMKHEVWICSGYKAYGKNHEFGCESNHIYDYQIEEIINKIMIEIFKNNNKEIKELENSISQYIKDNSLDKEIKETEKEIEKIKNRKRKLLIAYTDDEISKNDFTDLNNDLNNDLIYMEEKLKNLKETNKIFSNKKKKIEKINIFLKEKLSFKELDKDFIDIFINKITIERNKKISVELNLGGAVEFYYNKTSNNKNKYEMIDVNNEYQNVTDHRQEWLQTDIIVSHHSNRINTVKYSLNLSVAI